MGKIVELVTQAIRLGDRVETIYQKMKEMAQVHREEYGGLRASMHDIDKRVVVLETLLKASSIKRNARKPKTP